MEYLLHNFTLLGLRVMWNKTAAKTRQIAPGNDSGTTNNKVYDLCFNSHAVYTFISHYYMDK